jgi:hypothetical protein
VPAKPPPYDVVVDALCALGAAVPPDLDGALEALVRAVAADPTQPTATRLAVRHLVRLVAERAPGRTVELRVPPHAATQCVAGPRHTRGTPPNVVEVQPAAFVALAVGALSWADAAADGRLRASGDRAGLLRELLPLL